MRALKAVDYLNMDTCRLLAYWLADQVSSCDAPELLVDNNELALASYEAYGREGVAAILETKNYEAEDHPPQEITLSAAKGLLTKAHNSGDTRLMHVEFIKRGDGSYRKMTCRFGVQKNLTGAGEKYDPATFDLARVWDMNAEPNYTKAEKEANVVKGKGGYRSINLPEIVRLHMNGKKYIITENRDLIPQLPKD